MVISISGELIGVGLFVAFFGIVFLFVAYLCYEDGLRGEALLAVFTAFFIKTNEKTPTSKIVKF